MDTVYDVKPVGSPLLMAVHGPDGIGSVSNGFWVTDLTLLQELQPLMYLHMQAVIEGHLNLHLISDHISAYEWCPANSILCQLFKIYNGIVSLSGTSMWWWLYKMPSFTVNSFVASLSYSDTGCLVAAISSRNLLWLSVRL